MSLPPLVPPIISPIRPYPWDEVPYTNVSPLTIRDNATMQWETEKIKQWIRDVLVPHVDEKFAELVLAWATNVGQLIDGVNKVLDEQTEIVNETLTAQTAAITAQLAEQDADVAAAIASIINSTIEVSDPVIMGIITNPQTQFAQYMFENFQTNGTIDARRFAPDLSTITTAVVIAAIEAANGRPVYIHGSVNFGGGGLVYAGNKAVNLVGLPGFTKIFSTAPYAIVINDVGSAPVRINGIEFDGGANETVSATVSRGAVHVNGRAGDIDICNNVFRRFVNSSVVRVVSGRVVKVNENRILDCYETHPEKQTRAGIYVTGVVEIVQTNNNVIIGGAINPMCIGIIFVGHEDFAYVVKNIVATGNQIERMKRAGIGITHENSLAVFNSGELVVSDNVVKNCLEQGIKIKVGKRVHIQGNLVVGCNTVPELINELDGGINVQSSSESTIVGNTIINDGTDGIRFDCKQELSIDPVNGELGRANHLIANNTIKNAAIFGIRIGLCISDLAITGNTIVVTGSNGIQVYAGAVTPDQRVRRINVQANVVRKAGATGINVNFSEDSAISNNIITRSGNFGIAVDNSDGCVINGNVVRDSGQTGANTVGIRIGAGAPNCVITGNSSGNRETVSQTYGASLGAAALCMANDFVANVTGRIQTTANVRIQLGAGAIIPVAAQISAATGDDAAQVNALRNALIGAGIVSA